MNNNIKTIKTIGFCAGSGSEFIEETRRIIEKIKDIKPIPREYLSKDSLYNEFI